MIIKACFLLILAGAAVEDIRYKRIHVIWLMLGILIGIINVLLNPPANILEIVSMLLPGAIVFIWSLCGKSIGKADGIFMMTSGLVMGSSGNYLALMCAFVMSGIAGLVCLIKKYGRDYEIPFIPFVLAGVILEELLL